MSLYRQTLFIIGSVLIGLLAIICTLSYTVLMEGFARLDKDKTSLNVEGALSVLEEQLDFLSTSAYDWAAWNDTYAFIQDGNKNYIETNLVETTFTGFGLNLILFVNSNDQIVFGKAFDLQSGTEVPLPQGLQDHLYTGAPLLHHRSPDSSVVGIILLSDGPMLVASRPIVTSSGQGPIRGSLIMGKYLGSAEVEKLAQIVKAPVTVFLANDPQMPADFQTASLSLPEKKSIFVKELSSETIAGYGMVNDIYGKPALILRVDTPKAIYKQGKATINIFLVLFLLAGLVSGMIAMVALEKLVLSRIARFSRSVTEIGKGNDLSARVPVNGNDEVSKLAADVNEMLSRLEQSQMALRESKAWLKNIMNNVCEAIVVLQDGVVRYSTPRIKELTGYSADELVSRHFLELIHPDDHEIAVRRLEATLKGEELSPPYYTILYYTIPVE